MKITKNHVFDFLNTFGNMQGRPRKRTCNFRQLPRFRGRGPAERFFRVSHFSEFARYADEKCPNLGLEKEGGPPPLKCTVLYDPLANLANYVTPK